jgi:hypothetical protein
MRIDLYKVTDHHKRIKMTTLVSAFVVYVKAQAVKILWTRPAVLRIVTIQEDVTMSVLAVIVVVVLPQFPYNQIDDRVEE